MAMLNNQRVTIVIYYNYLLGGLEHIFSDCPYIGNVIIPTFPINMESDSKFHGSSQHQAENPIINPTINPIINLIINHH